MTTLTIGARVMWHNVTLGDVPATLLKLGTRYHIKPDHRPSSTWVTATNVRPMTSSERAADDDEDVCACGETAFRTHPEGYQCCAECGEPIKRSR